MKRPRKNEDIESPSRTPCLWRLDRKWWGDILLHCFGVFRLEDCQGRCLKWKIIMKRGWGLSCNVIRTYFLVVTYDWCRLEMCTLHFTLFGVTCSTPYFDLGGLFYRVYFQQLFHSHIFCVGGPRFYTTLVFIKDLSIKLIFKKVLNVTIQTLFDIL